MKLICIGDSLTFAPGVRRAQRWTELAAEKTGWKIVNLGISGDTTGGMLARLRTDVLNAPEVRTYGLYSIHVLIMGGGNDIFFSGSDIAARSNMSAMVHELSAAGLRPLVGLSPPVGSGGYPPRWAELVDFHAAAEQMKKYQLWQEKFCRAFDIYTIDFRPDFYDRPGNIRDELYLDGLHPGCEGQRLMAERLCSSLRILEQEATHEQAVLY